MTIQRTDPGQLVDITVELFGTARVKAGASVVPLRIPAQATLSELAGALARQCPALLGNAISGDDGGSSAPMIQQGYVINRNGLEFLSEDGVACLELQPGDALLLLSNQAGG